MTRTAERSSAGGLTGYLRKENEPNLSPYEVIVLTETFLAQSSSDQNIPNYRNFYAEAKRTQGRPSGGLAILTSPLLPNTKTMFKSENIFGVAKLLSSLEANTAFA